MFVTIGAISCCHLGVESVGVLPRKFWNVGVSESASEAF